MSGDSDRLTAFETMSGSALTQNAGETASSDDAEIARLARLRIIDYERERAVAAKALGIGRVAVLDNLVKERRGTEANAGQGRPLVLPDPEPWPTEVNGAALAAELAITIRRHVAVSRQCCAAIALWIIHTHAFEASPISPRLVITSPEKRCGKTTLLRVVAALVPRFLFSVSITPAALFRTVEAARPTLLVDEADTFLNSSDDLRGLINAGYA
jgi:putative DNA primase/helicase